MPTPIDEAGDSSSDAAPSRHPGEGQDGDQDAGAVTNGHHSLNPGRADVPTVSLKPQADEAPNNKTTADGNTQSGDTVAPLPSSVQRREKKGGATIANDDKRRSLMMWVDPELVQTVAGGSSGGAAKGTHSAESLPQDLKRLKKVVRRERWAGETEHETRKEVWRRLCLKNSAGTSVAHVYTEVEEGLFGKGKDSVDPSSITLPAFVDPNHSQASYALRSEGQAHLGRLLCVLVDTRPDILYCPLLAPVASMLLHYLSPAETFDCLSALLDSTRYKFMETSWVGHEAFRLSFEKLAAKFAASAHKMIARQGDPAEVYEDWIWWILEDLPFSHVIRVMDCYLSEGLKIFYRVGLAILTLYKKHRGGAETPKGLALAIREFVRNIPVTPNALLTVGFQFRGLSRSVIGAYQTRHKETLREDGRRGSKKQDDVMMNIAPINSSIITHQQLHTLWSWVPSRFSIYQPRLVFTTQEHGFSLTTFYARCEYCEPTFIIIKTADEEIFGAYLSASWSTRNDGDHRGIYFGTGESFIFSLAPEERRYPWVGIGSQAGAGPGPTDGSVELAKEAGREEDGEGVAEAEGKKKVTDMFMRATQGLIAIGGGDGDGILLEGDLTKGFSSKCLTFANPPLAKERSYVCHVVEVITMEDGRNPINGET